jgi:hypothetical protein
MRLIDADELKKCAIPCEIHNGALTDLCVPLYQIENALTVEIPNYSGQVVPDMFQGWRCEERPQGEWKFKKFDEKTGIPNSYWCLFCGMVKAQVYDNFCGNCGADMRGGVE